MNLRAGMDSELKAVVVPKLRAMNFKGSFPHFRKPTTTNIQLLTFQFDKWGGGFVIEIAQCALDGMTTPWGAPISPTKVTAWDVNDRHRIQASNGAGVESWFRFDDGNFHRASRQVLEKLPELDEWWQSRA